MNYCQLFSPAHIALISEWFESLGKLFVRFEFPHSGGNGFDYQVSSLKELKSLIAKQTHPEIEIFIFKSKTLSEDEFNEFLELSWVYRNSDKVIYIAVRKNLNYFEPYEENPMKYGKVISEWFEGEA